MNILVDINHPCHIYLFKNFIYEMERRNNHVFITAKENIAIVRLLKLNNISYIGMGHSKDGILHKIIKQIKDSYKIYRISKKYKIDLAIGVSISIPQASFFSKYKSIMLDDDDDGIIPLSTRFAHPFADCIMSPDVLRGKRKRKDTIYYSGYHELAYLHPNRFIPDPTVLSEVGLKSDETFFLMRFNAFKAHHDYGALGLTLSQKLKLIEILSIKGKVFVSTERDIEPELANYQLTVSPEKIHSLLYFATMFVGDSQTMTSEAAVLGVPSIRCNSFVGQIAYLEEEEHKYGLTYGFKPDNFSQLLVKVQELLKIENLKEKWKSRRQRMLIDKIDVTAFMVWFVENYPESSQIIKENPNYQYRFK
jgi:uncharacterized protein